jgi:hypothetical protein
LRAAAQAQRHIRQEAASAIRQDLPAQVQQANHTSIGTDLEIYDCAVGDNAMDRR